MSVLDWSFVSLLAAAFLFLFFGLLFLLLFFLTGKNFRMMKRKRPPKNKKKRKRFIRHRQLIEKQWKRQRTWMLVFLLLAGISSGGALYSRYYQRNHLAAEETEALAKSYYLLEEVNNQLNNIKEGTNPQKSIKNIQDLSSRLASYGARKPILSLSEDNQRMLKRHFVLLQELGVNLNAQTVESLQAEETYTGYLGDIERIQTSQSNVFKHFRVNESALKQKQ
ncbi:hypothetical protein [Candidatus Enterococcus clewellii]|uniref:Uncharacterized protein n=1 Tax=Candidatus Enterococcus clewellii TaxID=1834193 RepID=A0A242KAV0_9ENTE|nr:hypothetical protein [Enterococcus sp. 9E7_DIV0242]OTP17670.1 hypothetical protein A5888_001808 [Enterococcus sp. 9E7_DIV0242]